jgi:hypothetical protein
MELGFRKLGRFNRKRKKTRKTADEPSPKSRHVAMAKLSKIYQEYGKPLRLFMTECGRSLFSYN